MHVVQALLEIPRINPREKDKVGGQAMRCLQWAGVKWLLLQLSQSLCRAFLVQVSLVVHYMQNGYTPLHYAAEHGHLPVVQALIRDPRVDPGEAGKVWGIVGSRHSGCLRWVDRALGSNLGSSLQFGPDCRARPSFLGIGSAEGAP